MPTGKNSPNWAAYAIIGLLGLVALAVASVITQLWVLTALPVGFLFGFFLQKGDLCGSSAFSEVILMKDARKVWGLWVAIAVSMLGFALLAQLGWVKLNPKPMTWLSFLVGGVIFGTGTVLAGGCISGCLYKAGGGNLNSMAAIPGIFFGIAIIENGPLHAFNAHLKTYEVAATGGGSVTFSSLTGLPFWALALAFGVLTAVLAVVLSRRKKTAAASSPEASGALKRILTRPWRPWQAGIAIGLLGMAAYLSSAAAGRNYPLGVTHGVLFTGLLATDHDLEHAYGKPAPPPQATSTSKTTGSPAQGTPSDVPSPKETKPAQAPVVAPAGRKKVVWWLVGLVTCFVLGSWVAGRMSGQARLLPKPPEQTVIAFIGGILVGAGAALAKGCVIGNILSGIGLMSVGTVLFAAATVLANWVTTYIYLMGGRVFRRV